MEQSMHLFASPVVSLFAAMLRPAAALAQTTILKASPQGREPAVRPGDENVPHTVPGGHPALKTFNVEDQFGGWIEVEAKHLAAGASDHLFIVKR
jgi:ABC-type sulfate transport system substrate-binding protein